MADPKAFTDELLMKIITMQEVMLSITSMLLCQHHPAAYQVLKPHNRNIIQFNVWKL